MTTLNEMLFPVEKVANPATTNSEYAYIVKGIVDGVEMDLNYCSDRYELVPNDMIFPRVEADLEARGIKFTAHYHMIDNVRFYANYILEDESLIIGTGQDRIKPMIRINHSYNGLTMYSITFGYFRLVCGNGLVIPVEGQEEKNMHIRGKHTKDILNSLTTLWTKMDKFFEMQETIQKRFEVLTDRKIENLGERIEAVLTATSLKPSKAQREEIDRVIKKEANQLGTDVNDWLIYNGINAYIFKGVDANGNRSKAVPEKKRSEDKKVLDFILKNPVVAAE